MGDLRRKTGSYALQWHRSRPFFLTCANITLHLRQKAKMPIHLCYVVGKTGMVNEG